MSVRIIEPLDRDTDLRAGGWGTETFTTFYLLLETLETLETLESPETPEAPGVEMTASFRHYDLYDPDYPDFRAGRTMRIEAHQDADIARHHGPSWKSSPTRGMTGADTKRYP